MDTRSEKRFVFLPYEQIKKNFYALVDKELAYHGKEYVDELPIPRNTQLLSIYVWFGQLAQAGVSEKLKSRLATAALIELKNQIKGEYSYLSPAGGYLNWGSFVYKNINKIIGITDQNPFPIEEETKLLLLLAKEREGIIAKLSLVEELQKELQAKKVNHSEEKPQPKSWEKSSEIEVMKPETAILQKLYLWKLVHRDIQKHYSDKILYTAGMLHFRSCQSDLLAQIQENAKESTPIIPLTKQLKN